MAPRTHRPGGRRANASADLEVLKDVLEGALQRLAALLPTVHARRMAVATLDQALGREVGERLGAREEGLKQLELLGTLRRVLHVLRLGLEVSEGLPRREQPCEVKVASPEVRVAQLVHVPAELKAQSMRWVPDPHVLHAMHDVALKPVWYSPVGQSSHVAWPSSAAVRVTRPAM